MAKIHFAKDGLTEKGQSSTTSEDLEVEKIEQLFSTFEYKFYEDPPRINPEKSVNDYAAYQHVVLEIENGESTEWH